MPRVELVVSLPDASWIGRVSRGHPDTDFRVLSAVPGPDGGVGVLELRADDPDGVLVSIRDADLRDVAVLGRDDGRALVQFETATPMLLRATQSSGVPLEFPFEIRDGAAHWSFATSHDRLAALRDELDERGLDYRLDGVRGADAGDDDPLTDRQREVLATAAEAGYYERPRTRSLTELADDLGVAKSTLSGVLGRAEGALVREYVENGGG